jgi:hypothetical protein
MVSILENGPDPLSATKSLGEVIAQSGGRAVHILFVHGIRAGDRGSSEAFRGKLRDRVPGLSEPNGRTTHRLELCTNPGITFMGERVWSDAGWNASRPFVDRFEFGRPDGGPIILDEVNWWPLVLPLRCQALLVPEADLAGADIEHLRLCAGFDKDGNPLQDDVHYPWLAKEALDAQLAKEPPRGGAAKINGFVKRELMDWGLSDAVIALGPMRRYLHDTIDKAFDLAAAHAVDALGSTEFVIVAESLGSFIVFDAYAHEKAHVRGLLDRTSYLYFFANQLALLELGRLHDPSQGPAARTSTGAPALSVHQALEAWAKQPRPEGHDFALAPFKQIIAFSDPSDALTFRVPAIPPAKVVNVCDHNGADPLHLVAEPVLAHTGHSTNEDVLDIMFGTT